MELKTKKYIGIDQDGNYIEKDGKFVSTKQIFKNNHKQAFYRFAVDYCQPNFYIVDNIVYKEETYWKNTMLFGCGSALFTGKTPEEYFGEAITNYNIR